SERTLSWTVQLEYPSFEIAPFSASLAAWRIVMPLIVIPSLLAAIHVRRVLTSIVLPAGLSASSTWRDSSRANCAAPACGLDATRVNGTPSANTCSGRIQRFVASPHRPSTLPTLGSEGTVSDETQLAPTRCHCSHTSEPRTSAPGWPCRVSGLSIFTDLRNTHPGTCTVPPDGA